MKRLYTLAAVTAVLIAPVSAQTTMSPSLPPAQPGAAAPTTTTAPPAGTPSNDAGAPLSGANSFTEAQARSRIEQLGYTNVTGLTKDTNGIWRGKATKDGQAQDLSLDFRGNIVVGQK
jgi:opacity protein-like surface antigen